MKHKRLAGLLAFFMAACAMVPTTAFAANSSHTAQFIAEVTTANSKIEPGDTITVTFYMQGASWASMEQGTGFAACNFDVSYNAQAVSYKEGSAEYSKLLTQTFGRFNAGANLNQAVDTSTSKGMVSVLIWDESLKNEVTFASNDKTELFQMEFTVNKDFSGNASDCAFRVNAPSSNFMFGDMNAATLEPVACSVATTVSNRLPGAESAGEDTENTVEDSANSEVSTESSQESASNANSQNSQPSAGGSNSVESSSSGTTSGASSSVTPSRAPVGSSASQSFDSTTAESPSSTSGAGGSDSQSGSQAASNQSTSAGQSTITEQNSSDVAVKAPEKTGSASGPAALVSGILLAVGAVFGGVWFWLKKKQK